MYSTHPSSQAGQTLIEVLVTALVVSLIAAAAATALIATSQASGGQQLRSEADQLAAQDEDQMRGLSDEQLNALQDGAATRSHPQTFDGTTFTVTSGARYSNGGGTATGCTTGASAFYKATSSVSWTENGSSQSIEEDSLITRPVTGQMLVQVTDPSNDPLSGVSVVATAPSGRQPAQTNSAGCAVLTGLAPDNYTITLSKSGYVDINGASSSSYTAVAVGSSSGASLNEQLGPASGPINATFQVASGGGTGEADGLSWKATGMTVALANPPATATTAPTSTTATSSASLFPTSYAVWGGRCAGQEPPSGEVASATVPAAEAKNVTVTEPTLALTSVTDTITTTTGTGRHRTTTTSTQTVKPNDVVITYDDGTCTDSWVATVSPASTMPTTTGWLANPGQPYAPSGDLTVCADYKDPSTGQYYQGSATTGNTFGQTNSVAVPITENTSTAGKCQTT